MTKNHLQLSEADKLYLEELLSKGSLPVKEFKRATALLELNRHKSFKEISLLLNVTHQSVSSWCKRYQSDGLSFLKDAPRSGRPAEIDGLQRAQITSLACSDAPEGHVRWTLRLLAEKAVELGYCEQISHGKVKDILKKMNLSLT